LAARAGGYPGWTFPVQTQFSIQGPVPNSASFTADLGQTVAYGPGPMADGFYTWSVRSVFGALSSDSVSLPVADRFDLDTGRFQHYHFQVQRMLERNPVAPVAPVNLEVYQSEIGRHVITLSATSWDLNGDRLRLEFEVQPVQQSFTNVPTQTTNWLAGRLDSLRVSDGVSVGPFLSQHKWQVRAKDETGRASNWVYGGYIVSLP